MSLLEECQSALAHAIWEEDSQMARADLATLSAQIVSAIALQAMAEAGGIEPEGRLATLIARPAVGDALARHFARFAGPLGEQLWPDATLAHTASHARAIRCVGEGVLAHDWSQIAPEVYGEQVVRMRHRRIRTGTSPPLFESAQEAMAHLGAYYTPPHVAHLIATRALEPVLKGRAPEALDDLIILDPACGAGSILLAAWRVVEEHIVRWCTEDAPHHWVHRGWLEPGSSSKDGASWRVPPPRRAAWMARHMRGVDIDPVAIHAARCAFWLESAGVGAARGDAAPQLEVFARAAPAPAEALRCADALRLDDLSSVAGRPRVDVIVGNPPYLLTQQMEDGADFEAWSRRQFVSATYKVDTYMLFLERALHWVRPEQGRVALLTPYTWLTNTHAKPLRRLILNEATIEELLTFDWSVFGQASVEPMLSVLAAHAPAEDHRVTITSSPQSGRLVERAAIAQQTWQAHGEARIDLHIDAAARQRIAVIEEDTIPLGEIADAYFGVQTHDRAHWVSDEVPDGAQDEWAMCIDGAHVTRFHLREPSEWLCTRKEAIKSGGRADVHERERIVVRQIGARPIAAIAPAGYWALNTLYNVYLRDALRSEAGANPYTLHFLLGVLLSETLGWYWEHCLSDHKRVFPKVKKRALLSLPIPTWRAPRMRHLHDAIAQTTRELIGAQAERHALEDEGARAVVTARVRRLDAALHERVEDIYFAR